jgi:hypothetical protein
MLDSHILTILCIIKWMQDFQTVQLVWATQFSVVTSSAQLSLA